MHFPPKPPTQHQETAERILATLAGVPKTCHVRICRRRERCLGRNVACMNTHGEQLTLALAKVVADSDGNRNAAELPELLGKWRE